MTLYIILVLCFLYIASPKTPAGATQPTPQRFDTVFLVDSSNNVRDRGKYDLIRKFVANLTIELAKTNTHRVAIVSFSGAVYRLMLDLTSDKSSIVDGVKSLTSAGGFSYVSSALNYTFEKMFNKTVHVGDGKQVVVVLGGRPKNADAILKTAGRLKAKGLELYSVGIGDDFFVTTKELKALASLPVREHTLRTTYKSLLKSAPLMLRKLQKGTEKALDSSSKLLYYLLSKRGKLN